MEYGGDMIVLEGPDGSGKTSLMKKLMRDLGLPQHERASDSVGGPVKNLSTWAYSDVSTMADQPLSIYDRHPLVSEYIYGPVCRSYVDPNLFTPAMHLLIRMMADECLVIFCRPPNREIVANVTRTMDQQMPGVEQSILAITYLYDAAKMFWPGQSMTYDYTSGPDSYGSVLTACRLHIANQNQKRSAANG